MLSREIMSTSQLEDRMSDKVVIRARHWWVKTFMENHWEIRIWTRIGSRNAEFLMCSPSVLYDNLDRVGAKLRPEGPRIEEIYKHLEEKEHELWLTNNQCVIIHKGEDTQGYEFQSTASLWLIEKLAATSMWLRMQQPGKPESFTAQILNQRLLGFMNEQYGVWANFGRLLKEASNVFGENAF